MGKNREKQEGISASLSIKLVVGKLYAPFLNRENHAMKAIIIAMESRSFDPMFR